MRTLFALLGLWAFTACGGPPCRLQGDCPIGFHCALDVRTAGKVSGQCQRECKTSSDCQQPSGASRSVCTNEGFCRVAPRPPRLRVLEPEVDALYPEGTRRIRLSGEVQSAADRVSIRVASRTEGGCNGGGQRSLALDNPTPGEFAVLPFVIDDVIVDPGLNVVTVSASVQGSEQSATINFEVPCPGCARISIGSPRFGDSVASLELPILLGSIDPPVPSAVWRVHSGRSDLFDGRLPVGSDGSFLLERIPVFPGQNRVEVVVTGVGSGLGESRCSVLIGSGVAVEKGLRGLLTWDSVADLDVHLVGPGGRYGDISTELSARSPTPVFGGTIEDDPDGFGPEVLRLPSVPDGVLGLVVEPVYDPAGLGANAFLRLVYDGDLVSGAIGPQYLSADRGELWIAGTVTKVGDSVTFQPINQILPAGLPPTTAPSAWPQFY